MSTLFKKPVGSRKSLVATHIAPTPSNSPQRASLWPQYAFEEHDEECQACEGTGQVYNDLDDGTHDNTCYYCGGTGFIDEEEE